LRRRFSGADVAHVADLAQEPERRGRLNGRIAHAIARRAGILTWLCTVGAMCTFAPYLPATITPDPVGWIVGLAAHWQWAYAGLAVLGGALTLWLSSKHRSRVFVPLGLVAAAWLHQSPSAKAPDARDASPAMLTVASANLNFGRTDHAALAAWLLSGDAPDVIALQEFTESAMATVTGPAVLAAYPHRVLAPSDDPFGLGVLSKYPLASVEKVAPADSLATLKLRLMLDVRGHKVTLTAVHPMPPISATYARERDASLRLEAERIARSGIPGILLGDMNDTPWSTGLRAAAPLQRASGLDPTWPNAWGWLSILPLDHVLVTPGVRVEKPSLGPNLGSDHRPVRVRLAL
jgi:endonuclease/exonuclease/phosphatase (EEP) superfamily protein YafD